jgi:Xaa-Pro aminopeptidase
VEAAGPAGYWAELGGVFSFREPPELLRRKFETTVKAMDHLATLMRPGVRAGELSVAAEEVYRSDGWTVIGRSIWDAHGQGLRKHLPPHAWPGSQEVLRPNMILNQHPGVVTEDRLGFSLTNNYVVTPDGGRALGGFRHEWHLLEPS